MILERNSLLHELSTTIFITPQHSISRFHRANLWRAQIQAGLTLGQVPMKIFYVRGEDEELETKSRKKGLERTNESIVAHITQTNF